MVFIGIDWGTHSSKWFWMTDDRTAITKFGTIHRSTLWRYPNDKLILFPQDESDADSSVQQLVQAARLKRKMIDDPHGSFWEGIRTDTAMSLGHSVVFSLCCLIRASWESLPSRDISNIQEICFSFPNWLPGTNTEHDQALVKFRKAAGLAIKLLVSDPDRLPAPGVPTQIDSFVSAVDKHRDGGEPGKLKFEDLTEITDDTCGIKTSFLPESIAAGLPYLVNAENLRDAPSRFLIVDVGAGSTDVSYLTLWRLEAGRPFHFVYFPPAPAIGIAGGDITRALKDHDGVAEQEAELKKISLSNEGKLLTHLPYVKDEWIPNICRRVEEYVRSLPRHAHMRDTIAVDVIVSGGSGAITGLREELITCVNKGLRSNKNNPPAQPERAKESELFDSELFVNMELFETGRRVVSIGAGQPNKRRLVFCRKEDLQLLQ